MRLLTYGQTLFLLGQKICFENMQLRGTHTCLHMLISFLYMSFTFKIACFFVPCIPGTLLYLALKVYKCENGSNRLIAIIGVCDDGPLLTRPKLKIEKSVL